MQDGDSILICRMAANPWFRKSVLCHTLQYCTGTVRYLVRYNTVPYRTARYRTAQYVITEAKSSTQFGRRTAAREDRQFKGGRNEYKDNFKVYS